MKNIVFYAPPAAGKGTQCEILVEKYGYKVLSIGQVLRNQRTTETEIGRIIIETQDKGILTPDNIVLEALKIEIAKFKNEPIIIDGYPRNIEQAKMLDTLLDNYIVINLNLDRQSALQRITGRLSCSKCNKIYSLNSKGMIPKEEGICDDCGGVLISRDDDNEKSFNVRYDIYEQNAPLIKSYYREKELLKEVDSSISKENTSKEIEKILKNEE